jgi:hypothetical protein
MYVLFNPYFSTYDSSYAVYSYETTPNSAILDIVNRYLYYPSSYETYPITIYNTIDNSYYSYQYTSSLKHANRFVLNSIPLVSDYEISWLNNLRLNYLRQNSYGWFKDVNSKSLAKNTQPTQHDFIESAKPGQKIPGEIIENIKKSSNTPWKDVIKKSKDLEITFVNYKNKTTDVKFSNKSFLKSVQFKVL